MSKESIASRLRGWLNSSPIHDPVERRLAALLQVVLIGFIAVIVVAAVINWVIAEEVPWQVTLTRSFVFILLLAIPLGLLRRGYFRSSALILIAIFFSLEAFAVTVASLRENAETLSFFTLAIILAGLLLGRRALGLTFGLSAAVVLRSAFQEQSVGLGEEGITIAFNFILLNGLISLFIDRFGVVLRESEARLRAIVEAIPIPLTINSLEAGVILYGNSALSATLGVPLAEIVGQRASNYYADPDERAQALAELKRRGALRDYEVRLRRPDGALSWISLSTKTLTFEGQPGLLSCFYDITERKQAEAALRESEEHYRTLVDTARDVIFTLAPDGTLTSLNPSFETFTGWSRAAWLGRSFEGLMTEDDVPRALDLFRHVLRGEALRAIRLRVHTRAGQALVVELNMSPQIKDNRVAGVLGIARDMTEEQRAEDELRLSQARLEDAQARAHLGNWELDLTAQAGFWSKEMFYLHGRDLALGPPAFSEFLDLIHPADRQPLIEAQTRAVASGESASVEYRTNPERGPLRVLNAQYDCVKDAQGKVTRLVGTCLDITERKQAEAELQRRAAEFAALYETTRDLAQRQEVAELLTVIAQRAADLFNVPNCTITLYDAARGDLEIAATIGPDLPLGTRRALGDGLAGRIAQTLQPLIVDDYQTWAGRSPLYADIPYSAIMGVPMRYGGELIGVLDVSEVGPTPRQFTRADLNLLSLFAAQAAAAVHNARLFETTRRRLAEVEAVNRISTALRAAQTLDEMLPLLLDETLAAMGSPAGAIWLYDALSGELRVAVARGWFTQLNEAPMQPGEGIGGAVFAAGQAYLSREFAGDPQTRELTRAQIPTGWGGACVPIRTAAETVGVFFVAARLPRELQAEEAHLLTALAEIAGNAIHRMRLHQQTEQHVQRLSALRTIDMAITASLDLRVTLSVLLDQVVSQMEVDAADVLLLDPHTHILAYASGRGFHTPLVAQTRLRLGEGYAGRAALEGRVVGVPNVAVESLGEPAGYLYLRDVVSPLTRRLAGEGFVAYFGAPLVTKGKVKGVLELFHRAPLTPRPEWLEFLETLAGQAAIAIDDAQLFSSLERSNAELRVAYDATIAGWSRALELRDQETEGHTQRVTDLTLRLAREMGLSEGELVHVRYGALLHDIGKMGIPDGILLKPGPLTEDEWIVMREHPTLAYTMLAPIAYLRRALDIPYCHHEKWDGTGYPRGLQGEAIPLAARLFAVVDVWDALRSDRPYRPAWPAEKVMEHIQSLSGTHLDPQVVEVFLRVV